MGGVTNQLSYVWLKLRRERQECIRNPKSLSERWLFSDYKSEHEFCFSTATLNLCLITARAAWWYWRTLPVQGTAGLKSIKVCLMAIDWIYCFCLPYLLTVANRSDPMQLYFKSPCKASTGNLKPKLFWVVVFILCLFFFLRSVK